MARLTFGKDRFEVLVKPEEAWMLKKGKDVNVKEALIAEVIYRDASKGLKASKEELLKAFKTDDVLTMAKQIIVKGELQLTTEQRRRLIEMKRGQVIDFIFKNCVDPKTNLPHPPLRIGNALNEVGFSIDPFEDAEVQAIEAIKAIRVKIPIKMARALMEIKIPQPYAERVHVFISKMGSIKKFERLGDGSWRGEVELPAGLQPSLIDKLNSMTRGSAQVRLIGTSYI